ncbi:phospholipase [Bacterioplanoides sp.]|uniref:phospholipase n=1 Tax=Bacterioplanoides sp. TaxID=2066072 RepID=UPI003B5D03CF
MKTSLTLAMGSMLTLAAIDSHAFTQPTHKRIVTDAVAYMKANPGTTNFAKLEAAAKAAGLTVEQFGDAIGQGAYDVDDFKDTYLCGAVTGDCVQAPVFGIGSFVATYTAWWHFQNHSRSGDVHGNDIPGYNNSQIPVKGTEDKLLGAWLVGDHLDDGKGGMTGWCFWRWCNEDSEYNSYGITEKNYRLDTHSHKSHYEDFEKAAFQPIDNLGQYWYNQFLKKPTAQTLGFALHTTDLLQPHHTWSTSANNHGGWESWVQDNYDKKNMNDSAAVTEALKSFTPVPKGQNDIRPLLTEGGAISYSRGGIVLSSTSDADRSETAQIVIPHAIAMTVHVLNHAVERF